MDNKKFDFHVVGETSGETFTGAFEVRPVLTFTQRARADTDRRYFLGNPDNEGTVNEMVSNLAIMTSQIKYRVASGPPWAQDLGSLVDDNIIVTLFEKVMNVEKDYREGLAKKAEAAKAEMTAVPQT